MLMSLLMPRRTRMFLSPRGPDRPYRLSTMRGSGVPAATRDAETVGHGIRRSEREHRGKALVSPVTLFGCVLIGRAPLVGAISKGSTAPRHRGQSR